jgi:NAD(P)-dependent dehydrogenase (short-subunit alcohol dehydrogenase family)
MSNTETNHIALITGANRGIGRSAAVHLAQDGVDVIVTYRSHAKEAEDVVSEITALGRRALALQLDLAETGSFAGFADAVRTALQETWGRETFACIRGQAVPGYTAARS